MITETITFKFENEDQQRLFHERLKAEEDDGDTDAQAVQRAYGRMMDVVLNTAKAARAAAYEDAAKIADGQHAYWTSKVPTGVDVAACLDIGARIRARAKEGK